MLLYGLIGNPLGHSFSRKFFRQFFTENNIDADYENYELPDISDFIELIAEYPNIAGVNVTIPYKEDVMDYLQHISSEAKAIGAVNVIKIDYPTPDESPILSGYNTDYFGFKVSLLPLLKPQSKYKALILGTGGASKAVIFALDNLNIAHTSVSRTGKDGALQYSELTPQIIHDHNIIINTTPLGTYPNAGTYPDIPYDSITSDHICYDLVYNPSTTKFMELSAQRGALVKNGEEMLTIQALEAWKIWNENK